MRELGPLCVKIHVKAGQKFCAYPKIVSVFVEFYADHKVPTLSFHFQYSSHFVSL